MSADASDDTGVTSVQFKLDGVNLGSADTTSPYSISWSTTTATNGEHSLTAVATDTGGQTATSLARTVTVSNQTTNPPPTVALTAPADGATVTGSTTVSATASDDTGVTSVQFKLDGVNLGSADTTSPYSISWSTTTATNGLHSLTAVATDTNGQTTTSTARTVTVSNTTTNQPPSVFVTSPTTGTRLVQGQATQVSANATDADGTVASVQFFANGVAVGTDTTSPYAVSWTPAATGSVDLTAVATDSGGASATSPAVAVTVDPSASGTVAEGFEGGTVGASVQSGVNNTFNAGIINVSGYVYADCCRGPHGEGRLQVEHGHRRRRRLEHVAGDAAEGVRVFARVRVLAVDGSSAGFVAAAVGGGGHARVRGERGDCLDECWVASGPLGVEPDDDRVHAGVGHVVSARAAVGEVGNRVRQ